MLLPWTVLALGTLTVAAPTVQGRNANLAVLVNPYAPAPTLCPSTPLVRAANGINTKEAAYIKARKVKADASLATWLKKQGPFNTTSVPTLALASSGGGLRALLEGAGVVQGLDARDGNVSVSGVYQGLTYESGLSGGGWFLSSFAGNNWPTVTYLKTNLWEAAFQNSILLPANVLSASGLTEYEAVSVDITAKQAAGYDVTVVDPYGRILSYSLLQGPDGGVSTRLSTLPSYSNFTSHNVPYPIITAIGVNGTQQQCFPSTASNQYEFSPYEYGSWDSGIAAFANTIYMGSSLSAGRPTSTNCTVNYDNLGYILGTSSDVFNGACEVLPVTNTSIPGTLEGLVSKAHVPAFQDLYAIYPNPFYALPSSPVVAADTDLYLVDGGESEQNVPIWPFIQPSRSVIDVVIASDNSADTSDNFPNGTEIHQTYLNAHAAGLTRMPYIPPVATFVAQGLNKRATFFGCNATGTVLIVYLPNVAYTYPSGQSTGKLQYSVAETDGMLANGVAIANQNGTAGWSFCLACAISSKTKGLPKGCDACFQKYCYHQ